MKKILLTIVALSSYYFTFAQVTATVVSGNCSSATISATVTQSFPTDIILAQGGVAFFNCGGGQGFPQCCAYANGPTLLSPTLILQRIETNGLTTTISTQLNATSATFSNVTPGLYQVIVQFPSALVRSGCSFVEARDLSDRVIGKLGSINPQPFFSNTVRVGPVSINDLDWNFIDANGSNPSSSGNLYAPGEEVRIQPTVNQNYDQHFIQVKELLPDGSTGEWRAKGGGGWGAWTVGKIGMTNNVESLTAIWNVNNAFSWLQFQAGKTYRVWVTPITNTCGAWDATRNKDFFICPQGWGCKVLLNEDTKMTISPNPANATFTLNNLDFDLYKDKTLSLNVYDIAGKEIKNYRNIGETNFDIQDIQNGMYVISVFANEKRIYTTKLVVKK
jgi:hypothetical protein